MIMESQFKPGDIVNLKSDKEHKMTVMAVNDTNCVCIWLDIVIQMQAYTLPLSAVELSAANVSN